MKRAKMFTRTDRAHPETLYWLFWLQDQSWISLFPLLLFFILFIFSKRRRRGQGRLAKGATSSSLIHTPGSKSCLLSPLVRTSSFILPSFLSLDLQFVWMTWDYHSDVGSFLLSPFSVSWDPSRLEHECEVLSFLSNDWDFSRSLINLLVYLLKILLKW